MMIMIMMVMIRVGKNLEARGGIRRRRSSTAQHATKGSTEFVVEDGVDDRVERRVAVAEPEDDGEQRRRNVELEQQRQRVDGEERQPAADERHHHDAEHHCGSPLWSVEPSRDSHHLSG